MTTITRPLLKTLRDEIDAALAAVAKKHGVTIQCGNARYTETSATFKLDVVTGAKAGESLTITKARADWDAQAILFGLKSEWMGRTFAYGGNQMEIIGLMPKRTKYPVLCRKNGDKETLLPAEAVRAILASSKG